MGLVAVWSVPMTLFAERDAAIIRAVAALADSLGMVTTAEGVETADEPATIRELGCTRPRVIPSVARFPSPRRGRSRCATAPTCARLDTSASRGQGRGHVGV